MKKLITNDSIHSLGHKNGDSLSRESMLEPGATSFISPGVLHGNIISSRDSGEKQIRI